MWWQRHYPDDMQIICTCSRQVTTPAPRISIFLQTGCASWRQLKAQLYNDHKTDMYNKYKQNYHPAKYHSEHSSNSAKALKAAAVTSESKLSRESKTSSDAACK